MPQSQSEQLQSSSTSSENHNRVPLQQPQPQSSSSSPSSSEQQCVKKIENKPRSLLGGCAALGGLGFVFFVILAMLYTYSSNSQNNSYSGYSNYGAGGGGGGTGLWSRIRGVFGITGQQHTGSLIHHQPPSNPGPITGNPYYGTGVASSWLNQNSQWQNSPQNPQNQYHPSAAQNQNPMQQQQQLQQNPYYQNFMNQGSYGGGGGAAGGATTATGAFGSGGMMTNLQQQQQPGGMLQWAQNQGQNAFQQYASPFLNNIIPGRAGSPNSYSGGGAVGGTIGQKFNLNNFANSQPYYLVAQAQTGNNNNNPNSFPSSGTQCATGDCQVFIATSNQGVNPGGGGGGGGGGYPNRPSATGFYLFQNNSYLSGQDSCIQVSYAQPMRYKNQFLVISQAPPQSNAQGAVSQQVLLFLLVGPSPSSFTPPSPPTPNSNFNPNNRQGYNWVLVATYPYNTPTTNVQNNPNLPFPIPTGVQFSVLSQNPSGYTNINFPQINSYLSQFTNNYGLPPVQVNPVDPSCSSIYSSGNGGGGGVVGFMGTLQNMGQNAANQASSFGNQVNAQFQNAANQISSLVPGRRSILDSLSPSKWGTGTGGNMNNNNEQQQQWWNQNTNNPQGQGQGWWGQGQGGQGQGQGQAWWGQGQGQGGQGQGQGQGGGWWQSLTQSGQGQQASLQSNPWWNTVFSSIPGQ